MAAAGCSITNTGDAPLMFSGSFGSAMGRCWEVMSVPQNLYTLEAIACRGASLQFTVKGVIPFQWDVVMKASSHSNSDYHGSYQESEMSETTKRPLLCR